MTPALVGCEFSGAVREALRARGVDAWSNDILSAEDGSPYHLQGDVLEAMRRRPWDLMIAHPPCTYLTNAGVRWLTTEEGRWQKMYDACAFFNALLLAPIKRIAVENPIPHGYAREMIGDYTQVIQPWMFGEWETKATCLWLEGLPKLVPTYKKAEELREALLLPPGSKPHARVHLASPGPNRWKERSRTLPGIARAFAEQWT